MRRVTSAAAAATAAPAATAVAKTKEKACLLCSLFSASLIGLGSFLGGSEGTTAIGAPSRSS